MKPISRLIMAMLAAQIFVLVPGGCPLDPAQLQAPASVPDVFWVALDEAIQLYDPVPAVPDPEQP
jgi:hypothetical protein